MDNQELNRLLGRVAKENCKLSFDKIFEYYYPKLVDFADLYLESRESAEEVASDVLLKLFVKRQSWMFVEKPEAYLYKSVKNLSLSYLRKSKKEFQVMKLTEKSELYRVIEPEASPEGKYIEEEFHSAILKIIDEMPPRRKMIFKLIRQEGKCYREVSTLLNISAKTVEVHMGLAIAHIRTSLEMYDKQHKFNYLRLAKCLALIAVCGLFHFF